MPDAQGQPTAQDLIKQKLMGLLQFGKKGAPTPGAGPTDNIPVNPDQNPDYQREPGGLLKRGQADAQARASIAQPPTQQSPTDVTDQNQNLPTTLTPVTPQGGQKPTTAGAPGTVQKDPTLPAFVPPAPPTPFSPPSMKSRLAHTFMYGALEGVKPAIEYNENIGTQEQKSAQDVQNYPQTLAAARTKYAQDQAALAKTNAETAKDRFDAQAKPTAPVKDTVDQQLAEAIRTNDTAMTDRILDVEKRQAAVKQDPAEMQLAEWKLALFKNDPKAFQAMYGEHGEKPETAGEFQYSLYKHDRPAFDAIFGGKDRTNTANQLKFLQGERDKVAQTYEKQINDILTTPEEKTALQNEMQQRLANYDQQIQSLNAGQQPAAAPGAPAPGGPAPVQPKAPNDPLGIR